MTIPNAVNPQIIGQTEKWLVVSKPAGWLTIPGRESPTSSRVKPPVLSEWAKMGFGPIWVVHRLDLETSGVVLFARSGEAHQEANSWFQNRKMKKTYFCIAKGVPRTPLFKVAEPIQGAAATTQIEVAESFEEGFLAKVLPQTGRRHQIRIHLSSKGFPIWGDTLYQGPQKIALGPDDFLEVNRVALHAAALELPKGERYDAPFPEDFQNWLDRLRKRGSHVSFK